MADTDPRTRLAQIKYRADDAAEQWQGGRGTFNANHYAPPIDRALTDGTDMTAALTAVLDLHRPVDIEPSDTICHGCSTLRGQGESARYFPFEDYPCPTVRAITDALGGDRG